MIRPRETFELAKRQVRVNSQDRDYEEATRKSVMPPPTSHGISHSITTLRLFPFAPYNRLSIYPCLTERVARSGGPFVSVRRTHYTARQVARMRVDASLSQRAREEWGVWRQVAPVEIATRGSVAR